MSDAIVEAFELRGVQDLATVATLRRDLDSYTMACRRGIARIDCSGLEFIGCVAIGVLVSIRNEVAARGTELRLVNVGGFHRRVFEIAGLGDLLEDPSESGGPEVLAWDRVSVLGRHLQRAMARSEALKATAARLCAHAEVLCEPVAGYAPRVGVPRSLRLVEPEMRRRRRRMEAHFPIDVLHIDGDLWPAAHGTLDVYQPADHPETETAQWELHFAPHGTDHPRLRLNDEYHVEVDTRDGRHFDGRAFLQHDAGAIWSLLHVGRPLAGLRLGDLA